jgi:tetratricopeptide (TPR) repeat protein
MSWFRQKGVLAGSATPEPYNETIMLKRPDSFLNIFLFSLLIVILSLSPGYTQDHHKGKKKDKNTESAAPAGNPSLLIDAKRLEITGNTTDAEDAYRRYVEKFPGDPNGHFQLSQILASQKKVAEAVAQAETAVLLEPGNQWFQIYLAELYQQTAKFDDAVKIYEELVKNYPENLDYYYQLGALYAGTGKYNDAIKIYNRIEAKTGVTEDVSLQKQKLYLVQKDFSGAEEEMQKLIAAFPDEPRYYAILAEMYMTRNMQDKALAMYNKVLEIDPDNAYIHMTLADFYRRQGDRNKALEELRIGFANPNMDVDTKVNILLSFYNVNQLTDELRQQALDLANILVATHPNDPKSYTVYGDLLTQDKKYKEARDEFMKAITLDSSRFVIWEEVLRLDVTSSDWKHLAEYGTRSIELFPEQPSLYLMTGMGDFQLKEYGKALDLFNRGVKLVVDDADMSAQFYMFLGDTYHAQDKAEESDKAYEKSLEIKSDNAYVLNNYAYYLSIRDIQLEKAETMAKKAVTIEPDNSSFQDTYGWVLYKLGRYQEAREWIGKALEDKENVSGEVLEHYGDVLFRLGDVSQALEYWKKAQVKGGGSSLLDKKITEKQIVR